jgi:pseudouridine synthase
MTEKIRLQKWLSQQGFCSRAEAENLVCQHKITINGKMARLGDKVCDDDLILVNRQEVAVQKKSTIVIAFYKPVGVETTMANLPDTKTINDFDFRAGRVFPIGRLDKASDGLLLLTNDGDLANRIAHPSRHQEIEYLVSTKQQISREIITAFQRGVEIDKKKTLPAQAEIINLPNQKRSNVMKLILHEGRNRQIRKVCQEFGFNVTRLLRIRVGKIKLGEMKVGKFRYLSPTEIQSLKNSGK